MSAPEEIVCETEWAFVDACARYGSFIGNFPPRHGDVSSGFKTVPVRIVYRPSPPSPALLGPLCPRCGAVMERIELGLNIESWRCRADGMFHPFTPPPPRDEAREAFHDWLRTALRGWQGGAQFGVMDMETAFLAGRASVKP